MFEKSYNKLVVFQKANSLALEVYRVTKYFPGDELHGITSQMRRAATSIAANIVEGYSRDTLSERLRFYNMAKESLVELEFFIDFAYKLDYLKRTQHDEVSDLKDEVGRLLYGFIKSVRKIKTTEARGLTFETQSLSLEAVK